MDYQLHVLDFWVGFLIGFAATIVCLAILLLVSSDNDSEWDD